MKKQKGILLGVMCFCLLVYLCNRRVAGINMIPLKRFAINYQPVAKNRSASFTGIQLPAPPCSVIGILNKSVINVEYEKYVLLIFLKLAVFEHATYHDDFELRDGPFIFTRYKDKSSLLRAYCEILGTNFISKKFGPEYLSPYDAIDYVNSHPDLKKDSLLNDQLIKFNKAEFGQSN
ncbi:hypothetical protein BDD43_5205 [Mucilaginibacter gracilis]|uniref:Uncharacterized protein n=1 Tax=Mucilaginibacter gracilis TaxID=423350 RepID=A0A495J988_9SPHI|nr:hypothetical protein [Mucilaginibacter gracilis]RKR84952.1 hypothetical protein BDD43_5205 [Mucilaginibacter gracilis]